LISAMLEKLIKNQFIRFLFAGGLNTVFGYGIFSFFLWLGLHYSLASLLSTFFGILFNFKTTGIIVFNSRNNLLILKFFGVYGVTYVLGVFIMYLFSLLHISAYISGAILILPMACVAFLLNKRFVFRS